MPDAATLEQQIELALEILARGGTVAYPTDTVYGLGADPYNEQAVERIYVVKKRPRNQPLPLLLADESQLRELADPVSDAAWQLISCFFPGSLTLVFKKTFRVPAGVTAGTDTVALRMPAHPVPITLIRGLGKPLVGTSANLSGMPSPVTPGEVVQQLGDEVDLIMQGGRAPGGTESTVIDVSGTHPVLLREGAISREELLDVCGLLLDGP